ncbi:MAG: hypothetical protein HY985_00385 [Magnetospirillum sp.]|nr:hypothetical protein [Magnetospirillum sp.]
MAYKDMPVAEILRVFQSLEEVGLFPQLSRAIPFAVTTVLERGHAEEIAEFEAMRTRCGEAMKHVAIHGYSSLEKQDTPLIQRINRIRAQVRTTSGRTPS